MERMKELIVLLNEASKNYYQLSNEIMTDREYDKLYDELLELEKTAGITLSQSPTQNVGYTLMTQLDKVKHESRMLSLDKTKDVLKLISFLGDEEGVLSWKLDGLTIVLKYNNGTLNMAVTRGNGEVGEDITHNAKVFANIPLQINFSGELVIRGEGIISFSEFGKINDALPDDEKYKNPRNLCSGTVRQFNSEICAQRNVMFYAFTLVSAQGRHSDGTKIGDLKFLKTLGFDVAENKAVTSKNLEQTVAEFEAQIENNDFASDGLVLTFNSIDYSNSLGSTSKFPRDSIAFKWADEMADTTLIKIDWSTSRTGLINPVAVFEPVELEGSTVERASVHNVSVLEELGLGEGDNIRVYKANMIIPQIAENLTRSGSVKIPKNCPVCQGETEVRKLREGKALYCTNPNCQAQALQSLTHFCGRNAMNIEGLSEETLKKLTELNFVNDYTDLYSLKKFEQEIKNMEGFGEKSCQKLLESIEKSKDTELSRFIYALGINHVGASNAKLLCRKYKNDLDSIASATTEELAQIDGFGEIIAQSVYHYFRKKENKDLLEKAVSFLHFAQFEEPILEEGQALLEGISVVITGNLTHFSNRTALQKKIEEMGGSVTSAVTKKTSYLVNNDAFSPSSKNKKAKELSIPILTEDAFLTEIMKIEI